jgi:hypothetical protein
MRAASERAREAPVRRPTQLLLLLQCLKNNLLLVVSTATTIGVAQLVVVGDTPQSSGGRGRSLLSFCCARCDRVLSCSGPTTRVLPARSSLLNANTPLADQQHYFPSPLLVPLVLALLSSSKIYPRSLTHTPPPLLLRLISFSSILCRRRHRRRSSFLITQITHMFKDAVV